MRRRRTIEEFKADVASLATERSVVIDLREVLQRALTKLEAYVGVCRDDKELTGTIIPMVRAALKEMESS